MAVREFTGDLDQPRGLPQAPTPTQVPTAPSPVPIGTGVSEFTGELDPLPAATAGGFEATGKAFVRGTLGNTRILIGSFMEMLGRSALTKQRHPELVEQALEARPPAKGLLGVLERSATGITSRLPYPFGTAGVEEETARNLDKRLKAGLTDTAKTISTIVPFAKTLSDEKLNERAAESLIRTGADITEGAKEWLRTHPEFQPDLDFQSRTVWENLLHSPGKTIGVLSAENYPNMLLAIGAYAAAGPWGAAMTSIGLESGDQFGDAKEFLIQKYGSVDKVPTEEWVNATDTATTVGILAGSLDMLPIMRIMERAGLGKQFHKNLTETAMKQPKLRRAITNAFRAAGEEIPTEAMQELLQIAGSLTLGQDKTLEEQFNQILAATLAAGPSAATTGFVTTLAAPTPRPAPPEAAPEAPTEVPAPAPVEEVVEEEIEAEPPAPVAPAPEFERREDLERRRRVEEMEPEELRRELLTDELTGIKNRRAFTEAEQAPVQVSIDADNLKWVNDNLGHPSGDQLLRTIGQALSEETEESYRIAGDEFAVQAQTEEEANEIMTRVAQRLGEATIEVREPDGTVRQLRGVGISYGVGENIEAAERSLREHKAERERAGERAGRGEQPPGAVTIPPEGVEDRARPAPEEVKEPEVITEEDYLTREGAPRMKGAEPALHRTPGGFPKGQREKHLARVQETMRANIERREQLREEYAEKVRTGEIRPPSRIERLVQVARGHEDRQDVQAARRLLEKEGVDWRVPKVFHRRQDGTAAYTGEISNDFTQLAVKNFGFLIPRRQSITVTDMANLIEEYSVSSQAKSVVDALRRIAAPETRPASEVRAERIRAEMTPEQIQAEIDSITEGVDQIEILPAEQRERLNDLKQALPTQAEEAAAAKERIKERVAKRKKAAKKKPTRLAKELKKAKKPVKKVTKKAKPRIEDIGEKVGGARKDIAQPTGPRKPRVKKKAPPWRARYQVSQIEKSGREGEEGRWVIRDTRKTDIMGRPRMAVRETFETQEDAEKAVPLVAVAEKHYARPTRVEADEAPQYEIWRHVGPRKSVMVVNRRFDTREDAMRYMVEHAEEIVETKLSFGEEVLPTPEKVYRTGQARRDGDVKGEDFMKAFGFRAVEFGKWENQEERQEVMNHAYDALVDLAEILEIPPRALSLNGDLALAFGARGQGLSGAKAHYERNYGIINLTKLKGAGSLAHEWLHALDHYVARLDGTVETQKVKNTRGDWVYRQPRRGTGFATGGFLYNSKARKELQEAYKDLVQTMFKKAETYVEDTQRAEEFVGKARDELGRRLDSIRKHLAEQLDPSIWKRNNKPASAQQLGRWDELAEQLINGEGLELELRENIGSRARFNLARMSNDILDEMSDIYKAVRGRSGFLANREGTFDRLRGYIDRYRQRIQLLQDAMGEKPKEKRVPTSFFMQAKGADQARAGEYWASPHEMAARAFAAYVEDKLAAKENESVFLVYRAHGAVAVPVYPEGFFRPYPEGKERDATNAAFDRLFEALKVKETEKGVALYANPFDVVLTQSKRAYEAYQDAARRGLRLVTDSFLLRFTPLKHLPDKAEYLKLRYRALGRLADAERVADKLWQAFKDLGNEQSAAVYEYLITKDATPSMLLPAETRRAAEAAKRLIRKVGRGLVARGLLSEDTFEEHKDSYLPRMYLRHLLGESSFRTLGSGKRPSDMGFLKQRKDIPEDVRQIILGEITDPGFLASRGAALPMRDMALLDFMSDIAKQKQWIFLKSLIKFDGKKVTPQWLMSEAARIREQAEYYPEDRAKQAHDLALRMERAARPALEEQGKVPEEFRQVPDSRRWGLLRGLWVRKEIYDDLIGSGKMIPEETNPAEWLLGYGGLGTRVTQLWKMSKVALNPPTQIRNFVSNGIMLHWSGVPFVRVPQRVMQSLTQILASTEQGRALMKKAGMPIPSSKHWRIAKKWGVTGTTFSANELFRIQRSLLSMLAKDQGKFTLASLKNIGGIVANTAGDVYQLSEAIFKTAKIIDAMEREGMSEADAVIEAQKWLYDYSLIPPSVRYLRNAPIGVPFLTFYYKTFPRFIEVITTAPHRMFPYVALGYALTAWLAWDQDVDEEDVKKLKKALPEWLQERGSAYVLPYRDQNGRWQAVDFGYFFPWSMFTEGARELARGDFGDFVKTTGVFGGPLPDVIAAIKTGKDPFTRKPIFNEHDPAQKQVMDLMTYVWRLGAPTWTTDMGFIGKMKQAIDGEVDKYGDVRLNKMQAALRLFGVNVYPIEPNISRMENLRRMRWELEEIKRRGTIRMRDRNLTSKQRKELREQYLELISEQQERIVEYEKASRVHPRLR